MPNYKYSTDEQEYIRIAINGKSIFMFFVILLFFTFFGQWFFGNYQLRSPIIISFRLPFESRVVPVNATEHKVKVIKLTPTPKKVSMVPVVEAQEFEDINVPKYRTTVPLTEGIDYIKKTFSDLGEENVKIAIAISKSENFVNAHPDVFVCDQYGSTNKNGTVDLGAMQINSQNWDRYGGEEHLKDCFNNWDAAYKMRVSWQNWTAWSAFNNKSYLNFMN